jgi:hypothetical protein
MYFYSEHIILLQLKKPTKISSFTRWEGKTHSFFSCLTHVTQRVLGTQCMGSLPHTPSKQLVLWWILTAVLSHHLILTLEGKQCRTQQAEVSVSQDSFPLWLPVPSLNFQNSDYLAIVWGSMTPSSGLTNLVEWLKK